MAKKKSKKKNNKNMLTKVVGGAVLLFVVVWLLIGGITASSQKKAYLEKVGGEPSEAALYTSASVLLAADGVIVLGYDQRSVKEHTNIFAFGNSYKYFEVTYKKEGKTYKVVIPMALNKDGNIMSPYVK